MKRDGKKYIYISSDHESQAQDHPGLRAEPTRQKGRAREKEINID